DAIETRLEEYRRRGTKVVVIEAPLLIEADWVPSVDEVWVTVAPEAVVLERILGRSGLSKSRTLARIRAQLSAEERLKHATVVIDTDCTLDELKAKVKELWQRLQK
ncbi:MAG: dephospho-CoA kinase, partial [Chloroflexota bacterium]|nr:dephospho-CoA kinase [Chloroflexota bacterium]